MLPYIQDPRGFESSTEPKLSAGLRTPRPPLFNTCVYTIVVLTSLCPNSSWTVRISYAVFCLKKEKEWRVSLAGSRGAFFGAKKSVEIPISDRHSSFGAHHR